MRVMYKWGDSTVVAEVQSIILEPVATLFSSKKTVVTLQFFDGGELCLGECKESATIYEQALSKGQVNLLGYTFNK